MTLFFLSNLQAQQELWKKNQIMPTKELADKIKNKATDLPVILNVGPMENIKGAIRIAETSTNKGIAELNNLAVSLEKNKEFVIYCGCCTYANCPNIGPAFQTLQHLGFKKIKVLDIPEGFKPDWVAKSYPVE